MLNLIAIWRAHGLPEIMREAWESGVVLSGQSAGAMCWFEHGVTLSAGKPRVADGMGFLPGALSVHYARDPERRECLLREVKGGLAAGLRRRRWRRAPVRGHTPSRGVRRPPGRASGPDRARRGRRRPRDGAAPDPAHPGDAAKRGFRRRRDARAQATQSASLVAFTRRARTEAAPVHPSSHSLKEARYPITIAPEWRFRSSLRSSRSSRSRERRCRRARTGRTSRSGTASARSRSSTATTSIVQSRGGKPLHRYFPELDFPEGQYILDGELVILDSDGKEVFDALQNRIHPAESRINRLAEETPAIFRAFDLLAVGKKNATKFTLAERREALEGLIEGWDSPGSVELTPLTEDPGEAEPWLQGGEGVIAKELASDLQAGRAQGHGEDQARAHRRRRRGRLAPRQGGEHRRRAHPGRLRRRRAARRRPHLRPDGEAKARAGRGARAV